MSVSHPLEVWKLLVFCSKNHFFSLGLRLVLWFFSLLVPVLLINCFTRSRDRGVWRRCRIVINRSQLKEDLLTEIIRFINHMYYNTQERIIYCFDINGKMKSLLTKVGLYAWCCVRYDGRVQTELGTKWLLCRRKDALDWKHVFSYNTGLNNDYITH